MTKKTLRNRQTRRKHAAPKPKKAATVPTTPAVEAPKTEPTTFELLDMLAAETRDPAELGRIHALRDALAAEPKAQPEPEPTFTLKDFALAFGYNRVCNDPLGIALNAIEDLRAVIFVVNEHVHQDESGVGEVLTAAWNRTHAVVDVLERFRDVHAQAPTAEGGAS